MRISPLLNQVCVVLAGGALALMVIQITAASLLRSIFHVPVSGSIEITMYYYMIAISVLALGFTQYQRANIIVEVITQKLQPAIIRRLDVFALICSLLYAAFLLWATSVTALRSVKLREFVELYLFDLPIWPSRILLAVGFLGLVVTLVEQLACLGPSGSKGARTDKVAP